MPEPIQCAECSGLALYVNHNTGVTYCHAHAVQAGYSTIAPGWAAAPFRRALPQDQRLADRLESIDPTDFLYVLRDTAGKAAEALAAEIGRANLVLGKLEQLADQAEKVAQLAGASDLLPNISANLPPEAGLIRAPGPVDPMAGISEQLEAERHQRDLDWGAGPKPDEFPYEPIV